MTKADHCPACDKDVECYLHDGDYFCPICGRTKAVAEKKVKNDERSRLGKALKYSLLAIAGSLFIVFVILTLRIVPEEKLEAILARLPSKIGGAAIAIGLIYGLAYGVMALLGIFRKLLGRK